MIVLIWLTQLWTAARWRRDRLMRPHVTRKSERAKDSMNTAFYSHPDCRGHDMGQGHPECPQRLDAIDDHLLATGLDAALERTRRRRSPPAATSRTRTRSGYVAELARPARAGRGRRRRPRAIDPDTVACAGTWARRCCAPPAPRSRRPTRCIDGARRERLLRGAPARPPRHARRRRWASASSTTSRSPRATRSTCAASSGSRSSTSTSTTATAPRTSSPATSAC